MPVKLSKKEVETLLSKPAKRNAKPVLFAEDIQAMTPGYPGIFISKEEWESKMKTTITNYYASKGYIARKNKKTGEVDGESTLEIKKTTRDGVEGWILKNI